MVAIATNVNNPALIRDTLSPKLSKPTASPPRMTVKLSQLRQCQSNVLASGRVIEVCRPSCKHRYGIRDLREEGALVGKEDFWLDADGEGDALARR